MKGKSEVTVGSIPSNGKTAAAAATKYEPGSRYGTVAEPLVPRPGVQFLDP